MNVGELKEWLADIPTDAHDQNIEIMLKPNNRCGPSSAVYVKGVVHGFDWDNGRLLIVPATPLKEA